MAWECQSAPAFPLRQFVKPVQDLSTLLFHWAFVMKQGTVNHLVVGSIPTQAARKGLFPPPGLPGAGLQPSP